MPLGLVPLANASLLHDSTSVDRQAAAARGSPCRSVTPNHAGTCVPGDRPMAGATHATQWLGLGENRPVGQGGYYSPCCGVRGSLRLGVSGRIPPGGSRRAQRSSGVAAGTRRRRGRAACRGSWSGRVGLGGGGGLPSWCRSDELGRKPAGGKCATARVRLVPGVICEVLCGSLGGLCLSYKRASVFLSSTPLSCCWPRFWIRKKTPDLAPPPVLMFLLFIFPFFFLLA